MAVNYDFYKTQGALAKENSYHVRVVESGIADTPELSRAIQRGTTLTEADLKGAFSALASEMAECLKSGQRVHIEGIGYFSLSIEGEVVTDKKGSLRLKNPSVRSVLFKPESGLLAKLHDTELTAKYHRGRRSAALPEGEALAAARRLTREKGFFTAKDFHIATGQTRSTAYRLLAGLLREGLLSNIGTPHRALYAAEEA